MINDPVKLQKVIDELSYLLMQGNAALANSMTEYFFNLDANPVFDPASFTEKCSKDLNNFIALKVIPKMQELLGNSHYYIFHVMNPEVSTISRTGWYIQYNNLYNAILSYLKALEDIIFRLEDQLSLVIKREIAQQEIDQNVKYRITFSDHSRFIKLNGIELSKPDFDGLSHKFFSYIYNRTGQVVKIEDFEAEEKVNFTNSRRPVQVLADLGFSGKLKEIFFPVCTKAEVKFINPITNKYAEEQGLSSISDNDLSGRVRQSKK